MEGASKTVSLGRWHAQVSTPQEPPSSLPQLQDARIQSVRRYHKPAVVLSGSSISTFSLELLDNLPSNPDLVSIAVFTGPQDDVTRNQNFIHSQIVRSGLIEPSGFTSFIFSTELLESLPSNPDTVITERADPYRVTSLIASDQNTRSYMANDKEKQTVDFFKHLRDPVDAVWPELIESVWNWGPLVT